MAPPMRDARGCLDDAGVLAFRSAPPGRAPAELAAHVASCPRCQQRLLAADAGTASARSRRRPPPAWRIFVLFFAGLLLALLMFVFTRRMLGEP